MKWTNGLCLLWALAAGPAWAAGMTHFETWTQNSIGEQVLTVAVKDHGREVFKLTAPASQVDLDAWSQSGSLHLDWSHCRTAEMKANAGELTQCIRRAFLSLDGEGDRLAPAVLDLSLSRDGELLADYRPDITTGAKPLQLRASAELPTLEFWRPTVTAPTMVWSRAALIASSEALDRPGAASRFIFFGDAGSGDEHQYDVAAGLDRYCRHHDGACGFVLMLGDNFYNDGVSSTKDHQWKTKFEKPYSALGLDFYPVLGNHDHHGDTQAQLDYGAKSSHWKMPARYYTFTNGDVQFFGIDSDDFDEDQEHWLQTSLQASTKPWKIVYAHHPIYSFGSHGDNDGLKEHLLPLLKAAGVDFYLTGHDHDKQIIERDGLTFIITGSGGARIGPVGRGEGTVFAQSTYGFSHFTIAGRTATLDVLDQDGEVEFSRSYTKQDPQHAAQP